MADQATHWHHRVRQVRLEAPHDLQRRASSRPALASPTAVLLAEGSHDRWHGAERQIIAIPCIMIRRQSHSLMIGIVTETDLFFLKFKVVNTRYAEKLFQKVSEFALKHNAMMFVVVCDQLGQA